MLSRTGWAGLLAGEFPRPAGICTRRCESQIETGEIVSRLPSLTELTGQTGLAVGTVRRAIDILAREHLVRTVPGRGTFMIAAQR